LTAIAILWQPGDDSTRYELFSVIIHKGKRFVAHMSEGLHFVARCVCMHVRVRV
jgi:hypothetical protein